MAKIHKMIAPLRGVKEGSAARGGHGSGLGNLGNRRKEHFVLWRLRFKSHAATNVQEEVQRL